MGWGGHVNVPCASSATCCRAAQMSGSFAPLYTLSKWSAVLGGRHMGVFGGHEGVGGGGGGHVKIPCVSLCCFLL